jgi:simple sugar transport system permease protein
MFKPRAENGGAGAASAGTIPAGWFPLYGAAITLGAAVLLTIALIALGASDPEGNLRASRSAADPEGNLRASRSAMGPGETVRAFFILPWSSPWFIGNTLDGIVLLLTASLGFAVAFRGGCFNLGGEGQIYLGGIAASAVLLAGGPGGSIVLGAAALAAVSAGGAMGALSGFLKRRFGANELITSFLLSAALSPLGDYLVSGPLRDPSGNLLATARFARLLPRIMPPSALSLSLIFSLILIAALHLFINRTAWGYRFRIAGSDPDFARYGGINPERCWIPAMTASGALGGLGGFFAVAGTYGLCHLGFPGGLGWNAAAVALIARNHPLALLPAALVYGWLKAGSDSALLAAGLKVETTAFIQAAVLLLATVRFTPLIVSRFRGRKRGKGSRK